MKVVKTKLSRIWAFVDADDPSYAMLVIDSKNIGLVVQLKAGHRGASDETIPKKRIRELPSARIVIDPGDNRHIRLLLKAK